MEYCRQGMNTGSRGTLLILVAALLISIFCAPAVCYGDADAIYRENSPAVVVVVAIDREGRPVGQGSGFVVRGDGAVVTNYHVISMAKDIKIKVGSKVRDVEGVLHADPENDLAILKLEGKGYPIVRIGDPNRLQVGEKVYVIGSPQGLENTISEGILSGIRKVDAKRSVLQMTAAISPGSSGGPVFNGRGEVVGVATFLISETQSLNFAMPVNLVIAGLSNKELASPQDACKVDYSETATCWFYQGLAYGSTGQHDSAAGAFERALAIDSKKVETYINLGVSYAKLAKYDEAMDMFNKALRIEPNQPEALGNLGAIYSSLGRYKEALAVFMKSRASRPDDPQTWYNLAVTYHRMDREKEAIEAVKEAARLAPDYAEAYGYLGVIYAGMNRYSEAAASFKSAIRLEPDDPRTHLGLGKVYASTGEKAAALEEYKILKKLSPKLADELFDLIYK